MFLLNKAETLEPETFERKMELLKSENGEFISI